jgi:hypothetical protein
MKKHALYILLLLLTALMGCEDTFKDEIPGSYFMIQTNPDDIYIYNTGNPQGVRLDPLLNDSIKVEVSISYSTPLFGSIRFVPNEGWFYTPNAGFYGIDNIIYTVCHKEGCASASITMYVEEPLEGEACTYERNGETIKIEKNQPVEIRIFANDIVCPYQGSSLHSPEKGTFTTFAYSGNIKNIVYVYYPPKNYVGTDRFRYRIYTGDNEYLETYCNITIE